MIFFFFFIYFVRSSLLFFASSFMSLKQEKPPGRTCVVGAGYVALECAGFLSGLNEVLNFVTKNK